MNLIKFILYYNINHIYHNQYYNNFNIITHLYDYQNWLHLYMIIIYKIIYKIFKPSLYLFYLISFINDKIFKIYEKY